MPSPCARDFYGVWGSCGGMAGEASIVDFGVEPAGTCGTVSIYVLPEEPARGLPRGGGALGAGHHACGMRGPTADVVAARGRRAVLEVWGIGWGRHSAGQTCVSWGIDLVS